MPGSTTFPSFEQAYLAVLRHVGDNAEFVNSPRGNASHETLGVSFRILDPRRRTLFLAARRTNPAYHFAEALWYLAGRRDVEMIAHYAPRRRADSRDGKTIEGSAYGARIFAPGPDGKPSPFERASTLLRTEQDTKRAVLPVFRAGDLDDPDSPDVPCLLALHFLLREGRLHMVCDMRANDADRGLIADVFSFTLIQEFTAALLGVDLGTYTHHVGSMHVAEADLPRTRRVLAEAHVRAVDAPDFVPTAMPEGTGWPTITAVMRHEELLRTNRARYTPADVEALDLPAYWQQAVLLFEAGRPGPRGIPPRTALVGARSRRTTQQSPSPAAGRDPSACPRAGCGRRGSSISSPTALITR